MRLRALQVRHTREQWARKQRLFGLGLPASALRELERMRRFPAAALFAGLFDTAWSLL